MEADGETTGTWEPITAHVRGVSWGPRFGAQIPQGGRMKCAGDSGRIQVTPDLGFRRLVDCESQRTGSG